MCWVSHFIQDSHTCQPQASPQGPTAVCLVEWEGGLRSLLRFLLAAPLFPLDPRQLLGLCVCAIYCSAAAGLSPAAGFSAWDSGGIRYWTSSVLMATLSGWSHLLKCSKVLGESRRKGQPHQTRLINYLMIISVTQMLPSRPPPISSYNWFSL